MIQDHKSVTILSSCKSIQMAFLVAVSLAHIVSRLEMKSEIQTKKKTRNFGP